MVEPKVSTPTWVAAFGCLASVACGMWLQAAQRPDPVEDLRPYVHRFTGPDPLECGRHLLIRHEGLWVPADEATLQKSVVCGTAAASAKRPFWTFKQDQGIDSWIATGILGTADGTIYRFRYDSAPCGGPGCESGISFRRCDQPRAVTGRYQISEFRCAK